ncbi:unnamed protein product [Knipowitschia caucasica]
MIGSVLYYGLYPLSRLLAGWNTEPSARAPSPEPVKDTDTSDRALTPVPVQDTDTSDRALTPLVDGTALCDGDTVTSCLFVHSQTAHLEEEQLPSGRGSGAETEERMSAQEEKDFPCEKDPVQGLTDQIHKQGRLDHDTLTKALEDRPGIKDVSNYFNAEETEAVSENNNNEGLLSSEAFEHLQTEDSTETCPPQSERPCLKELLASPKHATPKDLSKKVSAGVPVDSECWDEYISALESTIENREESPLCLVPPDHSAQAMPPPDHPTQSGYHFAVGPGLSNEIECPLWKYPSLSYYPTMENTMPLEVMWRVWEDLEDRSDSTPALLPFPFTKTEIHFTVMSYNILSQDLLEANLELYTHCPLEVLEWNHRCRLLLKEIQQWTPDILCLQEVQENHFYQELYPVLTQMGYTCVYKRRTGTKTDGCATCYRSCSFAEISVREVEYFRPDIELLDRHNVAIIVLLRPVLIQGSQVQAQGPPLCVANTHLLFNPRRGDIKLAQLAILLAEMDKLVKSCQKKGEDCNVILCGDFNSVPHTPLYQLITKGELYFQGLPAWMISGQEDLSYKSYSYKLHSPLWPKKLGISDRCQYSSVNQDLEKHKPAAGNRHYSHEFLLQLRFCPAACNRPSDLEMISGVTDATPDASETHKSSQRFRHVLSHSLDLQSVYQHVLPGSGNAEVTTLHSQVGATVDYIFYSPQRPADPQEQGESCLLRSGLKAVGCLSLQSEDALWSMNGLPSHTFPSDHLSLLAKFQVDIIATL